MVCKRQLYAQSFKKIFQSFLQFIFSILPILLLVHARRGFGSGDQQWDYVEVRPGAHMFWWLHYTIDPNVSSFIEKPLIIWLKGGPGASSSGSGNFMDIGPYDLNLNPRNHTWVILFNKQYLLKKKCKYAANCTDSKLSQ